MILNSSLQKRRKNPQEHRCSILSQYAKAKQLEALNRLLPSKEKDIVMGAATLSLIDVENHLKNQTISSACELKLQIIISSRPNMIVTNPAREYVRCQAASCVAEQCCCCPATDPTTKLRAIGAEAWDLLMMLLQAKGRQEVAASQCQCTSDESGRGGGGGLVLGHWPPLVNQFFILC